MEQATLILATAWLAAKPRVARKASADRTGTGKPGRLAPAQRGACALAEMVCVPDRQPREMAEVVVGGKLCHRARLGIGAKEGSPEPVEPDAPEVTVRAKTRPAAEGTKQGPVRDGKPVCDVVGGRGGMRIERLDRPRKK